MNNYYWIICLLFITLNVQPILTYQEIVDELNEMRRQVAKYQGVANMWKLEWDDDLVKPAYTDRRNPASENFTCFYTDGDEATRSVAKNDLNEFLTKPKLIEKFIKTVKFDGGYEGSDTVHGAPLMALLMTQTKVGCTRFQISYPHLNLNFNKQCCIGPYGLETDEQQKMARRIAYGTAGSACENGHGEDGLCVPGPGPPTSPPPPTTTTVVETTEKKKKDKDDEDDDDDDDDEKKWDLILNLNSAAKFELFLVFILVMGGV